MRGVSSIIVIVADNLHFPVNTKSGQYIYKAHGNSEYCLLSDRKSLQRRVGTSTFFRRTISLVVHKFCMMCRRLNKKSEELSVNVSHHFSASQKAQPTIKTPFIRFDRHVYFPSS
jgi:hypothetical protein